MLVRGYVGCPSVVLGRGRLLALEQVAGVRAIHTWRLWSCGPLFGQRHAVLASLAGIFMASTGAHNAAGMYCS